MKYYATLKHHSMITSWERLQAASETAAKREATKLLSGGLHGSVIHVVACEDGEEERLNDLPPFVKKVESYKTTWEKPYN